MRRGGFFRPRRIAPASRTLPSSSSNICFFTSKLLFDHSGELRNLFRRQIRRRVLRICVEQQKHVFSRSPIIDDAGAAPLSSRSNPDANLPYSATTFDQSAELRISGDPGLKPTILLVTQQSSDLPRKDRGLDQLHSFCIVRQWRIAVNR